MDGLDRPSIQMDESAKILIWMDRIELVDYPDNLPNPGNPPILVGG